MIMQELTIEGIPALLWGEKSDKLMIAVHGNQSHKQDAPIALLAQEAAPLGYQVLSFDLPQHGDRQTEETLCKVQQCVYELGQVMEFARKQAEEISLFACSMGAYFSLLAYEAVPLRQSLFLSPVVDMKRLIDSMMLWFDVSKERLQREKEISTPIGQTLYWDYYCYVQEHPILKWLSPTAILYGAKDTLCERDEVASFAKRFGCDLTVMAEGEHYFHTPEQLDCYREWLKQRLK